MGVVAATPASGYNVTRDLPETCRAVGGGLGFHGSWDSGRRTCIDDRSLRYRHHCWSAGYLEGLDLDLRYEFLAYTRTNLASKVCAAYKFDLKLDLGPCSRRQLPVPVACWWLCYAYRSQKLPAVWQLR